MLPFYQCHSKNNITINIHNALIRILVNTMIMYIVGTRFIMVECHNTKHTANNSVWHNSIVLQTPSLRQGNIDTSLLSISSHTNGSLMRMQTYNKFASAVIQSELRDQTLLWSRNITGEGQIVAIGDTGLDYDMCYFDDDEIDPDTTLNEAKRKVIYYETVIPDVVKGDIIEGHGTQIAGTIAGNPIEETSSIADYKGVAFRAKIAVFDFGETISEMDMTAEILSGFFTRAHVDAQARITCCSWGSDQSRYLAYDYAANQADTFVFETYNHLLVFAAGNNESDVSISSPASAKNVLAVGAVANTPDMSEQILAVEVLLPEDSQGIYPVGVAVFGAELSSQQIEGGAIMAEPADACSDLTNSDEISGNIVLVDRGQCWFDEKSVRAQEAGAIMLIVLNTLSGSAIDMNLNDASRANSISIPVVSLAKSIGDELRNAAAESHEEAAEVNTISNSNSNDESSTNSGAIISIRGPAWISPSEREQGNLAPFSSRGPTFDNRIKPDVVAPGWSVKSARSDADLSTHQCSEETLISESGTSMAAAVATGAAALVRQYFIDGFYPDGSANAEHSLIPTAALLKAVLINSGTPAIGDVQLKDGLSRSVEAPPSSDQGFGQITLSKVLYFDDKTIAEQSNTESDDNNNIEEIENSEVRSLYILDHTEPLFHGSSHAHCFEVLSYLKVTLVWTDPPTPLERWKDGIALVNNLDLVASVIINDEDDDDGDDDDDDDELNITYILGNEAISVTNTLDTTEETEGETKTRYRYYDEVNNVEQIEANFLTSGADTTINSSSTRVIISVHATNVPQDSQPYSLVASGSFRVIDDDSCEIIRTCPNSCSNRGSCDAGRCQCIENSASIDCSQSASEVILSSEEWVQSAVALGQWSYFELSLHSINHKNQDVYVAFELDVTESLVAHTLLDLYIGNEESLPTLSSFRVAARNHSQLSLEVDSTTSSLVATLPISDLGDIVRFGVYGFCCSSSVGDVTFRIQTRLVNVKDQGSAGQIALAVTLVCLALVVVASCSVPLRRFCRNYWNALARLGGSGGHESNRAESERDTSETSKSKRRLHAEKSRKKRKFSKKHSVIPTHSSVDFNMSDVDVDDPYSHKLSIGEIQSLKLADTGDAQDRPHRTESVDQRLRREATRKLSHIE